MLKASLEVLKAENTRITECRDVTTSSLLDGNEGFVGNWCLVLQCASGRKWHPLNTLHASASSEESFICKSSLLSFSGTPSVISFPFTAEFYNWQYTVTHGVSVFALPPELADCKFMSFSVS